MRRFSSSYYRSEMNDMLRQFDVGEIVHSLMADSEVFYGIVRAVNPKENKVYVAWNNGMVSQHDPDEIGVVLFSDPTARNTVQNAAAEEVEKVVEAKSFQKNSNFKNRRMLYAQITPELQPRRKPSGVGPKYCGNPELHGMSSPVSGGFSIMQNLVKELREESLKNTGLRSRRALYHKLPGRVYQRSLQEQNEGMLYCPRCRKQRHRRVLLGLNPYTKSEKIYICPACGWKITTDKLV